MTTYITDIRVDQYLSNLPLWQQNICQKLRDIIHTADPEVGETIKHTQPYFMPAGNICALLVTKDHVNIFIYDPLVPDQG
jgi:hypothetical protein